MRPLSKVKTRHDNQNCWNQNVGDNKATSLEPLEKLPVFFKGKKLILWYFILGGGMASIQNERI